MRDNSHSRAHTQRASGRTQYTANLAAVTTETAAQLRVNERRDLRADI
jgi:hypothetical protein